MATWRELIEREMKKRGESFKDVISIAPYNLDLDKEFSAGYGLIEGEAFTLWTNGYVYFPSDYDGAEEAESVPRNPNKEITNHIGCGG